MPDESTKTAAELMAELAADASYQGKLRQIELERLAMEAETRADEESLVSDLRQAGVDVNSVWDVVNSPATDPAAVPVLVNHLGVSHGPRIREGIVRALTTPAARGIATELLLDEFLEMTDDTEFKWLLGAAIAETATTDVIPKLIEILRDRSHGRSREMLVLALQHLPAQDVRPLLADLVHDPELSKSVRKLMNRHKDE
jgi:hypothetical protein